MSALDGPVGDDDPPDPVVVEVAGRQFDGLAGADQERGLLGEIAEDLARQVDRREGDRDRAVTNRGFGANCLGDREGMLEQASQEFAGGGAVRGGLVGGLDLAENLRFAKHEGIQSTGDAQQMDHRFTVGMGIEKGIDSLMLDTMKSAEPSADVFLGAIMGRAIEFGAVAGGENNALADTLAAG